jgi:predicted AAA+ superfamily ATPase
LVNIKSNRWWSIILYRVDRYDIKSKEQLKTLSKYYIVDTGIRNAVLGTSEGDLGHVLETVVYFELLRRGHRVFIGKWGPTEVDFIALRQGVRAYYQVTLSLLDASTRQRELAPLAAIPDNYEKTILTLDPPYTTGHEGIRYQSVLEFLLKDTC